MRKDIIKKIISEYKEYQISEKLAIDEKLNEARKNAEFFNLEQELKKLNFTLARYEAYGKDSSPIKNEIS